MASNMDKVLRITPEQLLSSNTTQVTRTVMWHGIAVTVRTLIPLNEVSQFINSVMDSCYDKNHDAFMPEMKDFSFRFNVVSRYACVDFPDNISDQYAILYNTDIFETILKSINAAQIASIQETINICMRNL